MNTATGREWLPEDADIHEIRAEQFEDFRQVLDAVAREGRYLLLTNAPPVAEVQRFVQTLLAEGGIHFVACVAGQLVGWCDVRRRGFEGTRHVGELGMGLLAEFRGRGLGRRLLATVLSAAAASGMSRIELEVFASNTAAMRLYERAGFQTEGRKRQARIVDGAGEDIICLARVHRGDVQIRRAAAGDLAAIHRVHLHAARGPDSLHRNDANTNAWLDRRTVDDYAREMRDEVFVVAEADGGIVGYGALKPAKAEITSVYVDPAATRRGIGRAIVTELERLAADAGLETVTLQAAGGALKFYRKLGYAYITAPEQEPSWAAMKKPLR